MAKKLTQEDLRYINDLKAYAIQNPDWFWSDADDASSARQYLYGIGGGGIVDEIYQETPDDIKKTISNKKLSTNSSFNKFHEEWKDKQEDASKVVAGTLAASAAAPFTIGGLASAAGTGALGNAGRYALGKADDAAAWLSKSGTKVYDPRHVVQTILNPSKAYTGVGQAAASTLDVLGAWTGLKHADETVTRWRNGDFHLSDVPQVGLDLMGTVPAINYFKQMGVSVPRMLTAMYDDTARAFNNMRDGVEPAYGIRPQALHPFDAIDEFQNQQALARLNEQSRIVPVEGSQNPQAAESVRLPDPPSEVTINMSGSTATTPIRPVQMSDLSPEEVNALRRAGLYRYDVQGLLDRGFGVQDMLRLTDTSTPGFTSNRRAQILEQRLLDAGASPTLPTRVQYLRDYVDNGGVLLNYRNRPYSVEEWNEIPETAGLDPFANEWTGGLDWITNVFFGSPRPGSTGVTNSSMSRIARAFERNYVDLKNKLAENISVFGNQWSEVRPKIQKILESGISSGKSQADIEKELRMLYDSYDKPFDFKTRTFGSGHATASSVIPEQFDAIFNPSYPYKGASAIRGSEYATMEDIPHIIQVGDEIGGPTHFAVIDPRPRDLLRMSMDLNNYMPHGGVTFELDKSLQSAIMAHNNYADLAEKGKGITTFLPYGWDHGRYHLNQPSRWFRGSKYHHVTSNTLAGSRTSPRIDRVGTLGINNPTAQSLMDSSIGAMERYLNSTQQKVFDDMGGFPRYGVEIGTKRYELPIRRVTMPDGTSKIVIERPEDFTRAISDYDNEVEKIVRFQDTMDKYASDINQLLSQKFPNEGYTASVTPERGVRIMNADGQENIDITRQLKNLPEYDALKTSFENDVLHPHYTAAEQDQLLNLGELNIHQPVAAFRYKKHGGKIVNNLNSKMKTMLNIK